MSAEPSVGLDLMTLKLWPELKSRAGRLTDWATQEPQDFTFSSQNRIQIKSNSLKKIKKKSNSFKNKNITRLVEYISFHQYY